jgi:hypothetical protein
MNSVTGESGPVSIDRPRPAVSHELLGRVERPGLVTHPEIRWAWRGRAPRPYAARWCLRAGGLLDDNACCACCTTGHMLRTSLTPSTREALARVAAHTLGKGDTSCLGAGVPTRRGPTVVWPACSQPVAARRRSLRPTPQPQPRAVAAVGPWRQPRRRPPRGGRGPSPARVGAACRAPALPRAQQRRGQGHPPATY